MNNTFIYDETISATILSGTFHFGPSMPESPNRQIVVVNEAGHRSLLQLEKDGGSAFSQSLSIPVQIVSHLRPSAALPSKDCPTGIKAIYCWNRRTKDYSVMNNCFGAPVVHMKTGIWICLVGPLRSGPHPGGSHQSLCKFGLFL